MHVLIFSLRWLYVCWCSYLYLRWLFVWWDILLEVVISVMMCTPLSGVAMHVLIFSLRWLCMMMFTPLLEVVICVMIFTPILTVISSAATSITSDTSDYTIPSLPWPTTTFTECQLWMWGWPMTSVPATKLPCPLEDSLQGTFIDMLGPPNGQNVTWSITAQTLLP